MVPDAANRAWANGERKQQRVVEVGEFHTFPDALRFALAVKFTSLFVEKRRRILEALPTRCLRGWVGFAIRLRSRENDPAEPVRCGLLRLGHSSTASPTP